VTRKAHSRPDVRIELWRSFISVLKSYAAAASLNGFRHGVLELTENSLNVVALSSTLNVGYYAALGRGVWSVAAQGKQTLGSFELNADGTVFLDGIAVDMDHGAIQLIGLLTSAAKLDEIEVPA
jgi:hypothetical protein